MIKLGAKELRTTTVSIEQRLLVKRNPIFIVLDNVLDTYNIGSIFRLADAVAAEQVILCGETLTPPHNRIKKASINTTEWVAWSYAPTAAEALREIKRQNEKCKIIAVEQDKRSVPYDKVDYEFPIVVVVGNETYGISKEVLNLADQIVELPMFGVNKSLNVMVSCGIVLFEAIKHLG